MNTRHTTFFASRQSSLVFLVGLALALFWLLGDGLTPARAATLDVCPSGCTYSTIQAAVTAASDGDTITIGAGTYSENVVVGAKRLTFVGAGAANTIVDGNNTGRVFSSTVDIALSDLTIQNGNATSGSGGGLYTSGAVTLTNVAVLSNTAIGGSSAGGGGIYAAGTAYVSGGRFENNTCTTTNCRGGGLYIASTSATSSLIGARFVGNSAFFRGGGVYAAGAVSVSGAYFENNLCTQSTCNGGGLRTDGTLNLLDTQFINNAAAGGSGAGGGGLSAGTGTAYITGGRFENNRCTDAACGGGGVRTLGRLAVTGTLFINNTAPTGGGVYVNCTATCGTSRLTNAAFARNGAATNGAALYFTGTGGNADVKHTTVASPTVGIGSAIYANAGTVNITNTVIANYATSLATTANMTITSDYNLFYNAPTSVVTGSHSITGTDPLLLNLAGDDYHLTANSPARDAGIDLGVTTDLDGTPRDTSPSMGAYEFRPYVNLATAGNGQGTVSYNPPGPTFPFGTLITLTAAPNVSSVFAGWGGECVSAGTGACSLTMDTVKDVTATFTLQTFVITPTAGADGSIEPSTPQTVNYGSNPTFTITAQYGYSIGEVRVDGAPVTVSAQPFVYTFNAVTADHTISATFVANPYSLYVYKTGNGQGEVTVNPPTFQYGDVITLTAVPSVTSSFGGWTGAVTSAADVITLTMDAPKEVTATFTLKTFVITPTAGAGGSLTPNTSQTVNYGDSVTFTITADAGYHVVDVLVDGASVGAVNSYAFNTVTADHTISAAFDNTYALTVTLAGNGAGLVTSTPPGINCGVTCAAVFTQDSIVTLTAVPTSPSTFAGWSGAVVATTNLVTLTMDGPKNLAATFLAVGPWYVSTTGKDSNDCLSWATACETVPGAANKANNNDVINIAAGTYYGNTDAGAKRLTLAGAGTANTLLDGLLLGRVYSSTADVSLSDLTIQNGKINTGNGGGLYSSGMVTLTNVNVLNNASLASCFGGGVYAYNGATVTGGRFENNSCKGSNARGGGLYTYNPLTIVGTQFVSNTASFRGGGAYAESALTVSDSYFERNTCTAGNCIGGGLRTNNALVMTNTVVISNTAAGGASAGGGGASANQSASVTGGRFEDNACTGLTCGGGALRVNGSSLALNGVQFTNNSALGTGGGVHSPNSGNNRVVNNVFARNSAGMAGAALYLSYNGTGASGDGNADILHNTIVSATAEITPAVTLGTVSGTINLVNNILAGYTAALSATGSPSVTANSDYNLYYNASTNIVTGSHSLVGLDPLFADPAGNDYRLTLNSPAMNAGVDLGVTTDLAGNARPQGSSPDIGAYEYIHHSLSITLTGTGQGTVTVTPSGSTFPHGLVITLTAVPSATSSFVGWSGAVTSTAQLVTLTMDGPKDVTATFVTYRIYLPIVMR